MISGVACGVAVLSRIGSDLRSHSSADPERHDVSGARPPGAARHLTGHTPAQKQKQVLLHEESLTRTKVSLPGFPAVSPQKVALEDLPATASFCGLDSFCFASRNSNALRGVEGFHVVAQEHRLVADHKVHVVNGGDPGVVRVAGEPRRGRSRDGLTR